MQYELKSWKAILVELASWGRKYRGDFIAGFIAFLVPFLITLALKGFYDVVTLTSLVGLLSLLLLLMLGYNKVFHLILKSWTKDKFCFPIKVGILNGCVFNEKETKLPNSPFTDYTPQDWYEAISLDKNFTINWILAKQICDKFDIIINPFGEEYPETDKPNHGTLRQIVKFVKNGGVFVNVAGLAFYYSWDGENEDITGPLYETYELDSVPGLLQQKVLLKTSTLMDSSLYRYFGVKTTFFQESVIAVRSVTDEFFSHLASVGGDSTVKEFRSAYRSEKEDAYLKPLLKADYPIQTPQPSKFGCYPISALKFGKGHLLLCGLKLEKARGHDFEKEVEAICAVARKLSSKGEL
jgi:hypothetical protein